MKFTVKNKRHVRFEDGQPVVYQVGDIIEANEAEAKAFADKFEPVVEVFVGTEEQTIDAPVKAAKAEKKAKAAPQPVEEPQEAAPAQE